MTTQGEPAGGPSTAPASTQPSSQRSGESSADRPGDPSHTAPDAPDRDTSADTTGSPDPDGGDPAEPDLRAALVGLRSAVRDTGFPLVLPSTDEAVRTGRTLVAQLDDYLLPRLARLDAPLLVVVGGSTGAGKSTLVNSLVQARVSAAGVLRPTTRAPVLVCNPADSAWFRRGELLPGLTRTNEPGTDPNTLQLVAAPALTPGLAFLDAPDIDSVVAANRALANQLLAAADLWLFVTTAARYADAVPWGLLRTARDRGTVIALVLDRVPPEATDEVTQHLTEMLAEHDLAAAPLFVLPETIVDGQGLLPERATANLRAWFGRLAADGRARAAIVRQTLDGALAAVRPAIDLLAAAADEQAQAARSLDERVAGAYRNARHTVEQGVQDGRLLRGEVLARWQEFVGTGEMFRTLEARIGRMRDRVVAAITGRPAPGRQLQAAIESQLVTLLHGVAADAAETAYTGWQAHPAGAALLEPALARPAPDFTTRAERLVRDWQRGVLDLVRVEGGDRRFVARTAAYAVNATGLAVTIAVFASTAFIPTGLEVATGAGTTVAAQVVLQAIFGDQAVRTLAAKAREDLLKRVAELLDEEAARYRARTAAVGVGSEPGERLRTAAEDVEWARRRARLTDGAPLNLPGDTR
ncbi:ABC transporter [Plantactinospora sp. GCM10030261]|uniref:ABC transporter n=1 Tax=Plantactinospora sp. GCM10030261 TaxID=3273420 RepID=UPI00361980B6